MLNLIGLKSCDLITVPLGIPDVKVLSVDLDERGDVIITVESHRWVPCVSIAGAKSPSFMATIGESSYGTYLFWAGAPTSACRQSDTNVTAAAGKPPLRGWSSMRPRARTLKHTTSI